MDRCANSEYLARHQREVEAREREYDMNHSMWLARCGPYLEQIREAAETIHSIAKEFEISDIDIEKAIQDSIC